MSTDTIVNNKPSWWKRNWKWALPTSGCLFIVVLIFISLAYGAYTIGEKLSKETNVFAFVTVITTVQKNEEVSRALGKPIEIKAKGYDPEINDGTMHLEIELEGKNRDGILRVDATKTDDGWDYSLFEVTVTETGQIIDLKPKTIN